MKHKRGSKWSNKQPEHYKTCRQRDHNYRFEFNLSQKTHGHNFQLMHGPGKGGLISGAFYVWNIRAHFCWAVGEVGGYVCTFMV